ncbi:hypothetical protein GGI12_005238 [Dipsacomyces acuminosporus]|nr:hypothetical protein GGI12_005238 [Dipsacomyces acuminosporus]
MLGKKAPPPPPPSSRKPQIRPKPPGLSANRHNSPQQSPSPVPGVSDLRNHLKPVSSTTQNTPRTSLTNIRNSIDEEDEGSGIVEQSQGSVSSLAGMFGQRVRSKAQTHNRTLTGSTFTAPQPPVSPPPQAPARAPPVPPSSMNDRFSHQRTNSSSAPSHQLPPPPPPPPSAGLPKIGAANGSQSVPVREGKWSFHGLSELPPPPSVRATRHIYPSGNSTGSAIVLDI